METVEANPEVKILCMMVSIHLFDKLFNNISTEFVLAILPGFTKLLFKRYRTECYRGQSRSRHGVLEEYQCD